MFRVRQSGQSEAHESSCKPCPVAASSPVCGSDGHNYASEVKMRKIFCISPLKALTLLFIILSFALLPESASIKTLKRNGKCPCHRFK